MALAALGGTRLVWDAHRISQGALKIDGLHPEDVTGKTIRFGWSAPRCVDDAYVWAACDSNEPGHYVLALPSGTVISAPSMTQESEEEALARARRDQAH